MPKLNLLYRTFDGFERSFAAQANSFRQAHGDAELNLVAIDPEKLYEHLVTERRALSADWDIVLVLTDWLPELLKIGGMTRLNDRLADAPPQDWPLGWSPSLLELQRDADGGIFALPYHDGPEMFMYRADLFEDPVEQAAFAAQYGYPLRVPETWTQFRDVARFFTRPDQGLYGAMIAGLNDGHNNVYDFFIHLWSRGGRLFDAQWHPTFHDAIGREALQFYADLILRDNVCPPKTLEYDSVASGIAYAAGEAAMMWNWCGFSAVAELPPSKIIGQNRVSLVPRGENGPHMSLNIYWVLGIPAGSAQKDLAYAFLRHCATPEMDRITALSGGTGVRLSTWRDPTVQSQFSYYTAIEAVHQSVESPPRIPEYPAINEVFNQMQHFVVTGEKSVEQALEDAAAEVESIMRAAGYIP
ncbi:MAG: extracellular solute-binding protein [Anaerolineae bacterium]|nr:extracellular solute-binding protein [Anaerolineae bacterium]NUQ04778.1 extracellular solute-binding protein [Anaerolineae bacterium]